MGARCGPRARARSACDAALFPGVVEGPASRAGRVDPRRTPAGTIPVAVAQAAVERRGRSLTNQGIAMNASTPSRKAVILVSGGMDSAVTIAMAREQGFEVYALSVAYGQRHSSELEASERVAKMLGAVTHKTVHVDLRSIGGSALTADIDVPGDGGTGIPVTYVPARNTIMLSIALGWAEVLGSSDIFCGVNAVDYSGYPDCRPPRLAHSRLPTSTCRSTQQWPDGLLEDPPDASKNAGEHSEQNRYTVSQDP